MLGIFKNFARRPALFAFLIFLVVGYLIYFFDILFPPDPKELLVELHGLFLDLFLFGVILTLVNNWRAKRERFIRYAEELNDYRSWEEKEGMLRKEGIIRRFNQAPELLPSLSGFSLQKASLDGVNLKGVSLEMANLEEASLKGSNLERASLERSNLKGTSLWGANLTETSFEGAYLERADLTEASLEGAYLESTYLVSASLERANLMKADLSGANLTGANLTGANLTGVQLWNTNLTGVSLWGANLTGANLTGASFWNSNLGYAEGLNAQLLLKAFTLYKTELPIEIENELKVKYPEEYQRLIKKPIEEEQE